MVVLHSSFLHLNLETPLFNFKEEWVKKNGSPRHILVRTVVRGVGPSISPAVRQPSGDLCSA